MTAVVSLYGRLGQDPRSITTTSGKPMAVGSVAVEVATRGGTTTEWFDLVAFGDHADRLLRHQAGDMVAAVGRLQRHTWADREGNPRQQWQVVVDSLVSARTVRPGGKRKPPPAKPDFDDELTF